ncbi:MAG: PD-(D/E)XK nuclease family protein, partial [Holophagales bacterium]|nr:PD-(D/E)XK nuclease family protein [Holophagales bacterium]
LREPARVRATLAELRPMAEVGPVELGEVRRVLEPRLATLRPENRQRRFGRLFVASIDELRGRAFHTVFVPGLAEGLFPRKASEDPLLLDSDRLRLDEGLPTVDERVRRERRLLRIAIGAAKRRLVVSYPSLDTLANRGRVPSFYALDLLRAAEGSLPDLQQLERRAALASSSRLGWPAPLDPATAIDVAEYDLATLSGLLAAGDGSRHRSAAAGGHRRKGRARYLLDTNACLGRSLRLRYRRYTQRGLGEGDGMVTRDPEVLEALSRFRLAERAVSPTSLQHFAACPYRYHLHSHLGLRPRERRERLEQMDPATRGSIFHEAIFHLLTEWRAAGRLPMAPALLPALLRDADRVLARVAAAWLEDLAPAIPRVW